MASPDDSPSKKLPRRGAEGSSSLFEKVGEMVVLLEVQPETVLLEDVLQDQSDVGIQAVTRCIPKKKTATIMRLMFME